MSLLKEGDTVNFQKASCTLDGCVKIYTSRVDSVATDTGKLLSGLAQNADKKRRGGADDDDDDNADDDGGDQDDDGQKKRKKRTARSAGATLVSDFDQLQNKKMELEFSVDPLFKKASADFDEGGAKGLLLNHLAIDSHGRIVFDSSDDANDATAEDARATPTPEDAPASKDGSSHHVDIDIAGLAAKYFPDLSLLDEQDVCPSMKTFDLGDTNGSMDLPFLKAPEDWRQDGNNDEDDDAGNRSGVFLDEANAMGFDDDDDDDIHMGGFDLPPETGFGEGGEVWAREAARDPQARVHIIGLEGDDEAEELGEALGAEDAQYHLSMNHGRDQDQENILSYFDQALKKNWAGPEHWRIQRVKDAGKAAPVTKRKEKEPFEIDFTAPMSQSMADTLYTTATSNSTISLPKAQWTSKTRNLLPEDRHFNSRQLLRLFLKPKNRVEARRTGRRTQPQPVEPASGEVDEAYWANRDKDALAEEEGAAQGNYDADFFQDDGLPFPGGGMNDDDSFADARDHFSPPPTQDIPGLTRPMEDDVVPGSQADAFGAQLVTQSRRFRPEYVQYARVAKKVDVKRLKDELWRGIGFEEVSTFPFIEHFGSFPPNTYQITAPPQSMAPDDPATKAVDGSLTFTQVVNNLQTVYPEKAMADISTSYCFICLLHLANEKGLVIDNQEGLENLTIRRDFTADLSVGGD